MMKMKVINYTQLKAAENDNKKPTETYITKKIEDVNKICLTNLQNSFTKHKSGSKIDQI